MRLSDSLETTAGLLDVASDVDEQRGLVFVSHASSQFAAELRRQAWTHRWSRLLTGDDDADPEQVEIFDRY